MRLVLTRHGRTTASTEGFNAGITDVDVAQQGYQELEELKKKYKYPETEHYFVSALKRTKQTFDVLYPDKKIEGYLQQFNEHSLGKREGLVDESDEPYTNWLSDDCIYDEESFTSLQTRVVNAVKELYSQYGDSSVTIVCHAGIIRSLIMHFFKINALNYYDLHIINGMAHIFDIKEENGELVLSNFDTLGHIPVFYFDRFRLVLIRHGLTVGNKAQVLTGSQFDYMLDEDGIKELNELAQTVEYPKTDRYYATTLTRAQDTFKILYPNEKLDGLSYKCREIAFNGYDGAKISEIDFYGLFKSWLSNDDMEFEKFSDIQDRCLEGVSDIVNQCGLHHQNSATLVCHMGTIRCLLIKLLDLDPYTYDEINANNGLGYELIIKIDKNGYTVLDKRELVKE